MLALARIFRPVVGEHRDATRCGRWGVIVASGCDGLAEVARVGAGSTVRVVRVVGTAGAVLAGGGGGCCGEVAEPAEGVVDGGGPGVVLGEVQQPAAAGAGEGGRDGEQPGP